MSVSIKINDDVFEVTVAKPNNHSYSNSHSPKSTELTDNNVTKKQLLEFSFNFLLDREPNTSILTSFDIDVISKYFPNYRDEVNRWCDES